MLDAILNRFRSPGFYVTLFRYALVAVGGILVADGRMDPGQWETLSGGLLIVLNALFGGIDAGKNKVNLDGQSVSMSALPQHIQQQLEAVVPVRKSRNVFDIFLGK